MTASPDEVCCARSCPACDPNYFTDAAYWPVPVPLAEADPLRVCVVDDIRWGYFDTFGWFELTADGRPIL